MSDNITAEQLEGMIGERIKQITGMEPNDFRALQDNLKKQREDAAAETKAAVFESAQEATVKGYAKSEHARDAVSVARFDKLKGVGLRAARQLRAIAGASQMKQTPEDFALKTFKDETLADSLRDARERAQKAVAIESGAAGGFLLGVDDTADIIELLTASLVVAGLGAVRVPMSSPNQKLGRIVTGVTSGFDGESALRNEGSPTFGSEDLSLKKVRTIVALTNEALLMGHPAFDRIVRDEMMRSMSTRIEQALIRDDGSNTTPTGLRYQAGTISARTQAGASSTLAEVIGDLFDMISDIEDADIKLAMGQGGWIMRPGLKNKLASLRDSVGGFLFKDELSAGRLLGFPVGKTTIIPGNLGGGGDESELYFGDFSQVLLGEWAGGMLFSAQDGAAYTDSSGNTRAGFSADETAMKLTNFVDLKLRHPEAFTVRTAVDWQAGTS